MKKKILLTMMLLLIAVLIVACVPTGESGYRDYTVTITFDFGYESKVEVVAIKLNEKPVFPIVPERAGYHFCGWYVDSAFVKEIDNKKVISVDTVLHAKWEEVVATDKYYVIKYNPNNKTDSSFNSYVLNGMVAIEPNVPSYSGYKFKCWKNGDSVYDFALPVTQNLELTAEWEAIFHTVTFIGGNGETLKTESVQEGFAATAPTSVAHQYDSVYIFSGYDKEFNCITADTTVTALFTYNHTDSSLFNYTLNKDKQSYSISAKDKVNYPIDLVLPSEYNGLPITEIGYEGFTYNDFATLHVPSSYKRIRSLAFYQNRNLTSITLEEGVEKLDVVAFGSCYTLKGINLPSTLISVGENCFYRNYEFSFITVTNGNSAFKAVNDRLYSLDGTKLYFMVPTKVSSNVVIEKEVNYVSAGMFTDNNLLENIVFEGNIDYIGMGMFYNCSALKSVTFNGVVKAVHGYTDQALYTHITDAVELDNIMNYGAFERCNFLTAIKFNAGLEYVGKAVFAGCDVLSSVEFPQSIQLIAIDAFWNNPLVEIKMTGATENDYYIIKDNTIIEKGTGVNGGDKFILYASASSATSYVMPNSVSSLNYFAFSSAVNLKSVTLSDKITEIPGACFMDAQALVSVFIPSSVTKITSQLPVEDGVQKWARCEMYGSYGAFSRCMSLSQLDFNSINLTEIGDAAFFQTGISSFFISKYLSNIGVNAFMLCKNLAELIVQEGNLYYASVDGVLFNADKTELIVYPTAKQGKNYIIESTVKNIRECAFSLNQHLENIVVNEGCETIGDAAFNNCLSLKKVELPASLKTIESQAFTNSFLLESITFKSATPELKFDYEFNTFSGYYEVWNEEYQYMEQVLMILKNLKIYVPNAYYIEYFNTFYSLDSNLIKALSDNGMTKTLYHFETFGGTIIADVTTVMLLQPQKPELKDYYFWGWYYSDGTINNVEWGNEISFPLNCDKTEVTIFARWEKERLQNGLSIDTCYDITTAKSVTFNKNGTYYLCFTAAETGIIKDVNSFPIMSAELQTYFENKECRVWAMVFSKPDLGYDSLLGRDNRQVEKGKTYWISLEIFNYEKPIIVYPLVTTVSIEIVK
ncbi:MAG: leucine-rich repeat protein [Clostridia bacterium]